MSLQRETHNDHLDTDMDYVEIVGMDGSDDDVSIIGRDDVSNYNPDNILPESPEVITKIRQWLDPTEYNLENGELRKHLASHMPGTGQWLFAKSSYQKWHDGQDNGLLFIKGIPGSGKSVFAATLIDELSKEGHPVLFFFFRQIIDANYKPVNLLRDWLDQILEYSPPLQCQLKTFVDEKNEDRHSIDNLNIDDLWKYLKMALVHMPKVYLVADALDEMDKGNGEFLQALARLGSWRPATTKVIITSRPVNTIEEPLRNIPAIHVRLEEKLVDIDIATYVRCGIDASTITAEDRSLITKAVPGKANGLFLYAKLAMDAFLEPSANIRQVLQSLPADLNAMYADLLREHARRSGVADDIQILILSWVTHATRPLRLLELAEFIRTSNDGEVRLDIKTAKHIVRDACGPLLEVLPDETISVVHHSLTEFLSGSTRTGQAQGQHDNDRQTTDAFPVLTPEDTHERLAVSCLRYLLSGCLDGWGPNEIEKEASYRAARGIHHGALRLEYPSLAYAAENWFIHTFKATNMSDNLSSTLASYLDHFLSPGPRLNSWLSMRWLHGLRLDVGPCHIAARYGLTSYLRHLLSHHPNKQVIDARDDMERTQLFLAASEGHAAAVKLLIAAGADPDAENRRGIKPLHVAARANHVGVVTVLLEAGVSPLTPKSKGRQGVESMGVGETPLMYACKFGHLETIDAFIPHLAGCNNAIYSALDWASQSRRSKIVKRLLQYPGIDVKANPGGKTAFRNGCQRADIESMEALIEAGVTPDMSDLYTFFDACSLTRPTVKGGTHPDGLGVEDMKCVLDLFLNADVPVHQCDPHLASGNPILLKLLLQAGADPNYRKDDGSTLLHGSFKGEAGWEILRLLVEEGGADVNKRRTADETTPLQAQIEAYECHVDNCIRFIQQYQPDCTLTNNKGQGPLISLMRHRGTFVGGERAELLETLVAAGASLNQRDQRGNAPIHYVLDIDTVALLVELGADINSRDKSGTTRLMHSLGESMSPMPCKDIDRMVSLGADLHLRDFRGRTLLHQVHRGYMCNREIRDHLITLGLDPLVVDYSGKTLLHELVETYKRGQCKTENALVCFKELLDLGVDPNTPDHAGRTILHALSTKPLERTGLMFDQALKCCDIESVDHEGFRPIHLAAETHEFPVFSLIAAGADVSQRTYRGQTPLHIAADAQESNIMGMLIDALGRRKDGDPSTLIDAIDDSGRPALYYACKTGRLETVALLLEAGASVKAMKDSDVLDAFLKFDVHQQPRITFPAKSQRDRGLYPRSSQMFSRMFYNHRTNRLEEIADMLVRHGLDLSAPVSMQLLREAIIQGRENHYDYIVKCLKKLVPATADGFAGEPLSQSSGFFIPWHQFTSEWAQLREQSIRAALDAANPIPSIAGKPEYQIEFMMELLTHRQFELVEATFGREDFDEILASSTYKTTPLHLLVSLGYSSILAKATTADKVLAADSLELGKSGLAPLVYTACVRKLPNMEVLRVLIEKLRASPNARCLHRNSSGCEPNTSESPLHVLAKGLHWWQVHQALPYLLSLPPNVRPDLEAQDEDGDTPLVHTLYISNHNGGTFWTDAVRMLIEAGANVNATHEEESCLSMLASDGDLELVDLLLKHGAKITGDVLFGAINCKNAELMDLLLSAGADPNMRRPDPAMGSTRRRSREHEYYPLYLAALGHSDQIVRQLLAHGADPFAKYRMLPPAMLRGPISQLDGDGIAYKELTVLHEIIRRDGTLGPFFEFLPNLDLESRNSDGETLLLTACRTKRGLFRMVKIHGKEIPLGELLIGRGADTRAVDKYNRNALHLLMLALRYGDSWASVLPVSPECLELFLARDSATLLSQRTDETTIDGGQSLGTSSTVLHLALHNVVAQRFSRTYRDTKTEHRKGDDDDSEAVIQIFLDGGADPHAVNGEGNTALHILARGMEWRPESRRLFEKFLTLGVDINATNHAGETPLFVFMEGYPSPAFNCSFDGPYPREIRDDEAAWRVFIDNGADFHVRDKIGRCLLHVVAASKLNSQMSNDPLRFQTQETDAERVARFKRLVGDMGLDPLAQDDKMRSSLDVAVACGAEEIMELFKDGGDAA